MSGWSPCTCAPCGRQFASVQAFDYHQDVDYTRRPAVQCKDPAAIGLVIGKSGRWVFPKRPPAGLTTALGATNSGGAV